MSWTSVTWPFVLLALVLLVPGLVVGAAAGLRRIPLVTCAPLVGYGVVAVGILLGSRLGLSWGLGPVLLATVLLAALTGLVDVGARVLRRPGPLRERLVGLRPRSLAQDGGAHSRAEGVFDIGLVVGLAAAAGLVQLLLVVRAVGPPDSVHQSFDAAFHLNAVDRVVTLGSASPATVGGTSNLYGKGAFYPPLFHGLAALLVQTTGVAVPTAANLTALGGACIVWPLSALGFVRTLAPRRTSVAAAAGLLTLFSAFPVLLMSFGVLWPNLMGIAALPAAVGLVSALLLPVHRASRTNSVVVVALLAAAGLYYAHPGTIFGGIAMCLPLLVVVVLRLATGAAIAARSRAGRWAALPAWGGVVAVAWLVGARLWTVIDGLAALRMLRNQDWVAVESYAQATGEVLTYSLKDLHPLFVVAALTIVGAGAVLRDRRVWLVASFVVVGYLYVLAAGTDEPIAARLTGFWYNDRFRILAMLPVVGLPLAAVGATWCADRLAEYVRELVGPDRAAQRPRVAGIGLRTVAIGLVGALVAVLTPVTTAYDSVSRVAARGYRGEPGRVLADPAEVRLYRGLATQPDPGLAVVGDPLTGAVLAGVLSHRPFVFGHLKNSLSPDQKLVAGRFKDFTRDPAVCGAVKRLRIGYVTEDTVLFPSSPQQSAIYAGLRGLSDVPGLTEVAHEGTVRAYRVGPCTS